MAKPIALLSSLCLGLALFATPGLTQPSPTSPATQMAQETPDLDQIVQRFTVQVMTDRKRGSGTLLAQKKDKTYLVLTNLHGVRGSQTVQVTTFDGQRHNAKVLDNRFTAENDLVLLEFTSATAYEIPEIGRATPREGWSLLSGGYGARSGKFQLSRGQLKQVPSTALKEGYQLGYDGTLEQGMSGGPIFEATSLELVGINGRSAFPIVSNYPSENGTPPSAAEVQQMRQLNWGVPIQSLLTQVDATIAAAYGLPPPADNTDVQSPQFTGWLAKLESNAKQVTVSIDRVGSHGSGVIIAQQGSTYTVLTADHVVACPAESSGCQYTVTTHDGQQHSVLPSSIIRREGVDLAVVQFNSNVTYPQATLANYNPQNQDYVFVAGHPQQKDQWFFSPGRVYEKEQGVFNITKTSLSEKFSLQPKPQIVAQAASFDGGYELIYTSITYGGMSGGGVFDNQGRVIGIHGQAEGEEGEGGREIQLGNSLGIPASTVVGLLPKFRLTAGQVSITEQPSQALTTKQLGNLADVILSAKVPQTNASGGVWIERGGQLLRLHRYGEAEQLFEKAIQVATPTVVHLAYYGKGLALAEQGKGEAAIQALEAAVRSKPNYIPAIYYLAIFHRRLEQYDKALVVIERAIGQQPQGKRQNAVFHNEKWGILTAMKRHAEALVPIGQAITLSPRSAFYLNQGNSYYSLQQYEKAIENYNQAIQINSKYDVAYYNRGVTYEDLQQYGKAIENYNQAIQINPKYANAFNNLGSTYYSLRQYEKAIENYNQAIQIDPKSANTYIGLGSTYYFLQQYGKAIENYNQAIQINPKYADTYIGRGSTYYSLQQYEKAVSDYTEAIYINPKLIELYYIRGLIHHLLQKYEKAITDYNQAIHINPRFANAYIGRGNAYKALQKYEKAITDYNQAIHINPKDADTYYKRGNAYYFLQQYDKAVLDYTQAIQSNPKYADAYYKRGVTYKFLQQYDKAVLDYNQAIHINPRFANAYSNRGNIYAALQQHEKAVLDYTQAIKINPKDAINYFGRGISYTALKEYDKAISDYTEAIQLNLKLAEVYNIRGITYKALQQYDKATLDFTQAVQINPKYTQAYYNRGNTYNSLQKYEKAIADFILVLQKNPKDAGTYVLRGDSYSALQQYEKALFDYTQAIQVSPKLAKAYFKRGVVYHSLQQYDKAITDYNTALSLNPKRFEPILNIGLLHYEQGSVNLALSQFQKALAINNTLAEAKLALAVALHQQGSTTQAIELAKAALTAEPKFASSEFQRKNLWGAKLIADTQKLLSHPALQTAAQNTKP